MNERVLNRKSDNSDVIKHYLDKYRDCLIREENIRREYLRRIENEESFCGGTWLQGVFGKC